ncbi:EF-hand domain pair [Mactra antiquata]
MSSNLSAPGNTLTQSVSQVDAGAMLLRLAGKPTKKGENDCKEKSKGKSKSKSKVQKKASSVSRVDMKPEQPQGQENSQCVITDEDWINYEMDEATLATFRDLFNTLDQSNTGIITADNLFEELRRLDSEITFSEVEDVLRKVDKDGNGLIDFDEFLYHMTTMGGDLFGDDSGDDEQKKKNSRRKQLFYNAITHFSIKQTLADIETTFRKQAPHVISHYTAGVRLIGLTTRQLERQMKKMQKSAAKNDSPYAKPLLFVHLGGKGRVQRKKIHTVEKSSGSARDLRDQEKMKDEVDPAVENLNREIKDTMMMFAQKRGSETILPQDANIIMQLRRKLGTVTAKMKNRKEEGGEGSTLTPPPTILLDKPKSAIIVKNLTISEECKHGQLNRAKSAKNVEGEKKVGYNGSGWTTPRIQYLDVPLPSLKMKVKSQRPTFNDLHRIRAKAKQAIDAYYHNLRQAEIKNAWEHWDKLYADVIPEKLLRNFKVVYSAYSPHREEEAFVVCPWKPGPFRFLQMQNPQSFSAPSSPQPGITGSKSYKNTSARSTKSLPNTNRVGRISPCIHSRQNHQMFNSVHRDTASPSITSRPVSSLGETSSFIPH